MRYKQANSQNVGKFLKVMLLTITNNEFITSCTNQIFEKSLCEGIIIQ